MTRWIDCLIDLCCNIPERKMPAVFSANNMYKEFEIYRLFLHIRVIMRDIVNSKPFLAKSTLSSKRTFQFYTFLFLKKKIHVFASLTFMVYLRAIEHGFIMNKNLSF